MRRAGLTLVLIVVGLALVGGALSVMLPAAWVPDTFRSLDRYVGTEGSVVGGVFGLGLIWAARHPAGNRIWVHLALLYALLLLAREAILAVNGKTPSLAPIIFGLATLALVLALYPGFGRKPPAVAAGEHTPPPPQPSATGGEADAAPQTSA